MKAKLFDFVKITDKDHKHFGRTGQLNDFSAVEGEYILYFGKPTKIGNVYWISDSTRIRPEQVESIYKIELERI